MPIIPEAIRRLINRRGDQLVVELAEAYRRIGIMHAVTTVRPPLELGDVDVALFLLDELQREATS